MDQKHEIASFDGNNTNGTTIWTNVHEMRQDIQNVQNGQNAGNRLRNLIISNAGTQNSQDDNKPDDVKSDPATRATEVNLKSEQQTQEDDEY